MFIVYNLLITFLSPLWVPWMLLRAAKRKEKPNWRERQGGYGFEPRKDRKRVWIHAVSVGEVMAALPILRELKSQLPEFEIVMSVTTSSGHMTAREHAAKYVDKLVYFPIDVARFQLAAMQKVRPAVVAIMETELWMNFLWAAKAFDAGTMLINGRISDRSFRRSRPVAFFYQALLRDVDRCLMQTDGDAERITALGGSEVEVFGNSKFDQGYESVESDPALWRKELKLDPAKPTLVIGSTRGSDEEAFVMNAIKLSGVQAQVIHAPRHIERAPELADLAQKEFGSVARRSLGQTGDYLVLDTYGELGGVYSVADVVIVGGGFGSYGGQNLIQPLALGKPTLHGPHMNNFRQVAEAAKASGASRECSTPEELGAALRELLSDPKLREEMGSKAVALVRANLGASARYAEAIAAEARSRTATGGLR